MAMDMVMGAVGSLISKLGELIQEEYKLQKGLPEKINTLKKELESAHTTLRVVAGVPPDQLDELVKIWAREVREASYDMEDVLDIFLVSDEGAHEHSDHESWFERLNKLAANAYSMVVSGKFSKCRKITFTINDINKRLEEAKQRHGRYAVDSIVPKPATMSTVDPRLEAMYTDVIQLVGIRKPSNELISKLSLSEGGKGSNKMMKIVSVVGAGGLGKTTLAKAVYDKLKPKFSCGAFVPIGRNRESIKEVFLDILIDLDKDKYMNLKYRELNQMQLTNELRDFLKSKRYLIVIDDIWDIKSWNAMKLGLPENNRGSRVITTTRRLDVGEQADEVYNLKPLPCDKSKNLFYKRIFGSESTCPDNQMDGITDEILKKCGGVPLAIITMASLLACKSREEWTDVRTSIFRDKGNQQVSDTEWILSLSYDDLPAHLKICLLYLSAFPEDYFIDKDTLIRKWAAEGFVHYKPGTRNFEVGEGYFNELINRSIIQPAESEFSNGSIDGCRVHDMVLDLLREKSREENFITISGTCAEGTSSPSTVRRLAHQNRTVEQIHQDTRMDLNHVRTFIACRCDVYPGLSFESFKLLRVLALENCGGWQQNSPIHLKHLENLLLLRYLGLRGTCIRELPEEIGSWKYLETLDLEETSVKELPYSLGLLTQLIYLCASTTKVQNGVIDKLTSLEELHICVDDNAGQFVEDLGKLRELRVLEVRFESNWNATMQSDLVKNLGDLHKIRHVTLFARSIRLDQAIWDTAVLPQPMRHLSLYCMKFYTLPSCINPSFLTNLSNLVLKVKTMGEQGLKILGGLLELRFLSLTTDSTVTVTIHAADNCFQKLTHLVVPASMIQFALNEDSSVSLTIWNGKDGMAFGSKRTDRCTVAPAVMLNLQVLHFCVKVQALVRNSGSCENLGLEYLPLLQEVQVDLLGYGASADDKKKEEVALWHAMEAHPKQPRLGIYFFLEEEEAALWHAIHSFD